MAVEIEFKYLVTSDSYKEQSTESHHIVQGFLSRERGRCVRVRLWDDRAVITIKGMSTGPSRPEYEYEIPVEDARELLQMCPPPIIDKTRHIVLWKGHRWEVDEFHGNLTPLVVAEIELPSADSSYALPPFVGRNVTDDHRYCNSQLGLTPVTDLLP